MNLFLLHLTLLCQTLAGILFFSATMIYAATEGTTPARVVGMPAPMEIDRAARYSGSYLVQLYQGETYLAPLPPGTDPQPYKTDANHAAHAYLSGVIDSGEGIHWCVNFSTTPPLEVDKQLIDALMLHKHPQANAAKILATILVKRFPCSQKASRAAHLPPN